jgi:acyl-CoA thioesterase FadM
VGLSAPLQSAGAEALHADGFRFVTDAVPVPTDFDAQGHLNNASTVRLFNDLRGAYVRDGIGPVFLEALRTDQLVVAAKEVHVLYESEGFPGESFVGAVRYVRREGKAAILEQRLVEASSGRAIARAWVLQLLVQRGAVIHWPDSYFARVASIEGHEIPRGPRRPATEWGPPAV